MLLTVILFFVLIAGFAAMFGVVKFSERVIARPGPANGGTSTRGTDNANAR
jgi:hypothetical protein